MQEGAQKLEDLKHMVQETGKAIVETHNQEETWAEVTPKNLHAATAAPRKKPIILGQQDVREQREQEKRLQKGTRNPSLTCRGSN